MAADAKGRALLRGPEEPSAPTPVHSVVAVADLDLPDHCIKPARKKKRGRIDVPLVTAEAAAS
jgi:hypothetical protein